MKSKHKNELFFEINGGWNFDELFKYIDTIKKKYPNAKIHVKIL
ncbi:hypothetical protein [[Clostridium] colinum]|nr:hypothetical protein [[Clostridium] colinum]